MFLVSNGRAAGPCATEPSRLNLLPWHGQLMVPSATVETVHPKCVQVAENPLNTPAEVCVTTTSSTIRPDPTGTSDVLAMGFAGAGDPGPAPDVVALWSPVAVGLLPLHAATTVAIRPSPAPTMNLFRGSRNGRKSMTTLS
jgi:hypothetical protein